jgi:SET domain-containing protein
MQIKYPDKFSKYLTIKNSKTGLGVFAKKFFPAETILCEIKGKLMTCGLDEEIDDKLRDNAIRFSSKYYLSPEGQVGDYFNHSCNPNSFILKINKKLYLKSARDILSGEEITFDYSTITARDDIWIMKCHCNNKNCRKIIGSFDKLSKKTKNNYLSRKMVPSYIY